MSWTNRVICQRCNGNQWDVVKGEWTCRCGKAMTPCEVSAMHRMEDAAWMRCATCNLV